jgi:hypothetical protein
MSEDHVKVTNGWVVDLSVESVLRVRVWNSRNASSEIVKFIIHESL